MYQKYAVYLFISKLSFSQLESLLGAALGNGGIEELMASMGLNGGCKSLQNRVLEIFFSGGLSEMLTMIEGEMNGNKFNISVLENQTKTNNP